MKNLLLILAFFLPFVGICQSTNYEAQYRPLVDKFIEVYDNGNLNLVDEIYAANAVRHSDKDYKGPEEIKKQIARTREAFPNGNIKLEKAIYTADKVVFHWIASGTIKATGETIQVEGVSFFTIANGKVIDDWVISDFMSGYRKLGYKMVKE